MFVSHVNSSSGPPKKLSSIVDNQLNRGSQALDALSHLDKCNRLFDEQVTGDLKAARSDASWILKA